MRRMMMLPTTKVAETMEWTRTRACICRAAITPTCTFSNVTQIESVSRLPKFFTLNQRYACTFVPNPASYATPWPTRSLPVDQHPGRDSRASEF
jgi:hypothetical protein